MSETSSSGRAWPFIIVGLLGSSVLANVAFLVVAVGDPSFAVEPDYYAKAVKWDDQQQEQANSNALGWKMDLQAERSRLQVSLHDEAGAPVTGAVVEVHAFHNARAQRVVAGTLESAGEGQYTIERPFGRPGIWEYRLIAVRGNSRFVETVQREIF